MTSCIFVTKYLNLCTSSMISFSVIILWVIPSHIIIMFVFHYLFSCSVFVILRELSSTSFFVDTLLILWQLPFRLHVPALLPELSASNNALYSIALSYTYKLSHLGCKVKEQLVQNVTLFHPVLVLNIFDFSFFVIM